MRIYIQHSLTACGGNNVMEYLRPATKILFDDNFRISPVVFFRNYQKSVNSLYKKIPIFLKGLSGAIAVIVFAIGFSSNGSWLARQDKSFGWSFYMAVVNAIGLIAAGTMYVNEATKQKRRVSALQNLHQAPTLT
jgi:hypothetical protein